MARPKTTADRISKDAAKKYPLTNGNDLETGKRIGYIAGATAYVERAQKHNNEAFQELENIHKKYHELNGDNPAANHMLKIARKYLQQWNAGNEVEQVKVIEYMPIHRDDARKFDCPTQFPMNLLNEEQAQRNHGQSLKRLKERGGLSVKEILAIVDKKNWSHYRDLQWKEAIGMLNDLLTNPTK